MLLISCPHCGPRDEIEFRCGGETHVVRPGPAEAVSEDAWADYLFMRQNPRGPHAERWLHAAGCRTWFNLLRDTVTHEIKAVYPMGHARPEVA